MQSSRTTATDKPVSAETLVKAITRPDQVTGIRVPTYPELLPTATTSFSADGTVVSAEGNFGLVCRDPMYPFWWAPSAGILEGIQQVWQYQSTYEMSGNVLDDSITMIDDLTGETVGLWNTFSGPYSLGNNDIFRVNGAAVAPFVQTGVRGGPPMALYPDASMPDVPWTWVPANTLFTVALVVPGLLVGYSVKAADVTIETIVSGSTDTYVSFVGPLTMNANVGVATAATGSIGRWMRPKNYTIIVNENPAAAGSWGVVVAFSVANCTNAVLPTVTVSGTGMPLLDYALCNVNTAPILIPAPFATGSTIYTFSNQAYDSVMPTGVRFTLENTTKIMNKEGSIQTGLFENTRYDPWQYAAVSAFESAIATLPAERRFRCGAEHGLACTVLPGRAFQQQRKCTYVLNVNNSITIPVMNIRNGDNFTLFAIRDPDISTLSNYVARVYASWEYASRTQFVQSRLCTTPIEVLHRAMIHLNTRPIFTIAEMGTVLAVKGPKPRKPKAAPQQQEKEKKKKAKKQKKKEKALPKGWHPPMAL